MKRYTVELVAEEVSFVRSKSQSARVVKSKREKKRKERVQKRTKRIKTIKHNVRKKAVKTGRKAKSFGVKVKNKTKSGFAKISSKIKGRGKSRKR